MDSSSGGYNISGLFLAVAALWELCHRSDAPATSSVRYTVRADAWLSSAAAFGSLMFGLHSLLADSSTLIAWSWTGWSHYKPNGPQPNLHGSLTLIAQCLGVAISLAAMSQNGSAVSLLTHPLWFLFGIASAAALYNYKNWLGYLAGLCFATFLTSVSPSILTQIATTARPGRTFFVAFLVAVTLYLADVWTVAYAFVPGGVYLRERTDL